MTAWRAYGAAGVAVMERDLRIFLSYRFRPLTLLISPLAGITLFYYVSRLVRVESVGSSDGYFAYVVVGIVGLGILVSTLSLTPSSVRQELVAGTFERIVVSPFGAVRSIAAMLLFPLAQATVVGAATLAFASLIFGMPVAWPNILLAPPAALLGGFAFAPVGLLAVAGMLIVKQALSAVSVLVTVLSIFAGVYFPVGLLPDWIQWLSGIQPFTPALDLLRHVVISTPTAASPWADVAKLVGFAVILLPLSLWSLQRALAYSRRRGTITEY